MYTTSTGRKRFEAKPRKRRFTFKDVLGIGKLVHNDCTSDSSWRAISCG